jgi:CHAT domain-containing protein
MSLWSVDDMATNIFMSYFYENLLSGNSKREAFILAQKSLRDIIEYSSPFYWSAFIMLD